MLRTIREVRPRWVVGENVFGLINWSGGLVFHEVQADLEAEGYEVFPYVLPACAVNAPHRRDRVWFVAHSKGNSFRNELRDERQEPSEISQKRFNEFVTPADTYNPRDTSSGRGLDRDRSEENGDGIEPLSQFGGSCDERFITDSGLFGQEIRQEQAMGIEQLRKKQSFTDADSQPRTPDTQRGGEIYRQERADVRSNTPSISESGLAPDSGKVRFSSEKPVGELERGQRSSVRNECNVWEKFPTQSPVCTGDDGISAGLDLNTISFSKWRNESIKAGGNAIVPQVVLQIFKAIEQYEQLNHDTNN